MCRLAAFSLILICIGLPGQAQDVPQESVPVGSYLNGVFPGDVPGSDSGFTTVNAFPNLRFIGPIWITGYPGTGDLVLVGKSGHVWRFPNDPDAEPSDVTVMLKHLQVWRRRGLARQCAPR